MTTRVYKVTKCFRIQKNKAAKPLTKEKDGKTPDIRYLNNSTRTIKVEEPKQNRNPTYILSSKNKKTLRKQKL